MNSQMYELTIGTGEEIREAVASYVLEKGWDEVLILGGIGSVIDVKITNPIENSLPLKTATIPVNGAAELLSLTGEVKKRERMDPALSAVYRDNTDPLFVHIHVSVGTAGGHVSGGGLGGGKAFRSVRIFMMVLDESGRR